MSNKKLAHPWNNSGMWINKKRQYKKKKKSLEIKN